VVSGTSTRVSLARGLSAWHCQGMDDFAIYELAVGGGTLALCPLTGRGGNYASDLAKVRAWVPDIVLTMVETQELAAKGAAGFGADVAPAVWLHLPVVDYQVPDASQAGDWAAIEAQILASLAQGARVLIHCMGGCGRSGMAFLQVMIAAGEPPDLALARLREVRPCAVETEAQMAWATGRAHKAP
jgi:hypothetical protein